MEQLDVFKQQQTTIDMLRNFMILKAITVLEQDLFFGDAIFNNEPDLAMFRYKKWIKENCEPRRFWSLNQDAGYN